MATPTAPASWKWPLLTGDAATFARAVVDAQGSVPSLDSWTRQALAMYAHRPGLGLAWARTGCCGRRWPSRSTRRAPRCCSSRLANSPAELVGYRTGCSRRAARRVRRAQRPLASAHRVVRGEWGVDREESVGPSACDGTYLAGGDLWMRHAGRSRVGEPPRRFASIHPSLCSFGTVSLNICAARAPDRAGVGDPPLSCPSCSHCHRPSCTESPIGAAAVRAASIQRDRDVGRPSGQLGCGRHRTRGDRQRPRRHWHVGVGVRGAGAAGADRPRLPVLRAGHMVRWRWSRRSAQSSVPGCRLSPAGVPWASDRAHRLCGHRLGDRRRRSDQGAIGRHDLPTPSRIIGFALSRHRLRSALRRAGSRRPRFRLWPLVAARASSVPLLVVVAW